MVQDNRLWVFKVFIFLMVFICFAMLLGRKVLIGPVYNLSNFKFAKNIDKLFVGASHSACSFNPEYINNSASVSISGEPLFFTYYKTKALLEQNEHIKTIILSFSPIHLSKYQDYRVINGRNGSRDAYLDYYIFLNESGKKFLDKFSEDYLIAKAKYDFGLPLSYMDDLKLILRYYFGTTNIESYSFMGGVEGAQGVHIEDKHIDEKIIHYFYGDDGQFKISELALFHLNLLITLCQDSSIELILVNTPVHDKFSHKIPAYYTKIYNETIKTLRQDHPHLKYYDYNNMKLPDEYFLDGDHLNVIGRDFFSKFISNYI